MVLSTAIPTLIAATVIVIISNGMDINPILPRTTPAANKLGAMPIIAKSQRTYKEQGNDYKAKKEDSVLLDYEGTIDGKNFDGGKAEKIGRASCRERV